MTSSPTRPSAPNMIAARSTRRAIPGRRSASAAAAARPGGPAASGGTGRARRREFGAGEEVDLSDIFEGLFGGGGGQRRGGGFGGFGGRPGRPPQKGADVAYRLPVAFEDAAALKPQRVTLSGGKTVDIKLPKGVEEGTKIRLAGQGQPGPAAMATRSSPFTSSRTVSSGATGDDIRLDLPIALDEAVLGAKVKVPTVDGAVMLSIPKGSSSGKTLRLKGKGFTGKSGQRGDQLVTLMVDIPADDEELASFVEGWSRQGQRQPAGRAGRLAPSSCKRFRPESPEARRKRLVRKKARFGKIRHRSQARANIRSKWSSGSRSASTPTASSMPATSPISLLLSLFPFVIVAAAVARLFGQTEEGMNAVIALFQTMPPDVAEVLVEADQRRAPGPYRRPALARRDRRPVDDRQLHRDDPRHHPPRLWRHVQPPLLGISPGLGRNDHRLGDHRDGRVQPLGLALRRPGIRRRHDPRRRRSGRTASPCSGWSRR